MAAGRCCKSDAQIADPEQLIPKRGATSAVWNFFGFKMSDVDQTTVTWKCCRAKVVAGGGNISNLLHHLSWKHVLEYKECLKLRSAPSTSTATTGSSSHTSIKDAFFKGILYEKKSKRWVEITNAITFHLVKDMVLIHNEEKDGFKMMVKKLDPRYVLPDRKYFSKTAIHVHGTKRDISDQASYRYWLLLNSRSVIQLNSSPVNVSFSLTIITLVSTVD